MGWLREILRDFAGDAVKEDAKSQDVVFWVPGNPATFATAGEKQWKETLYRHISACKGIRVFGLEMRFYLKDMAPRGHPLDLDNLCEPVFSVLVNRLQWFGGSRPNIRWWCASKERGTTSGLKLTLFMTPEREVNMGEVKLTPVFDHTYTGVLPRSATDPVLASWVESRLGGRPVPQMENCVVLLRFAGDRINLGDIATGRVKALLDCLYPLIGGAPRRPEDWRIRTLAVEKGSRGLPADSVQITVWEAV